MIDLVTNDEYILEISRILKFCKPTPIDLIRTLVAKAVSSKDIEVLSALLYSIDEGFTGESDLAAYFLSIIHELSDLKSFHWLLYYYYKEGSIIDKFDRKQIVCFLTYLVPCPDVDYHLESLLIPIAKRSSVSNRIF